MLSLGEIANRTCRKNKSDEIPHRCAGSLLPSARTAGVERQTDESHRPVGALAQRAAASTKHRTGQQHRKGLSRERNWRESKWNLDLCGKRSEKCEADHEESILGERLRT